MVAAERALEALRLVLHPGGVKSRHLPLLVEALQAHASSAVAPSAHCVEAIDLISGLQARLAPSLRLGAQEPAEAAGEAAASEEAGCNDQQPVWKAVWLPWLRTLSVLCLDTHGLVRDHAIVALQRALLHADVKELDPHVWAVAFDSVVFPWLAELLQREVQGEIDDERLKRRAVTLLSKAFLHHLQPLLGLETFHLLWLRAVELLEQFMKSPNNELLLEAVPETLKNMLLVMNTSGAFEVGGPVIEGGQSLPVITKAVIDGFCPGLCDGCDLASLWEPMTPASEPNKGELDEGTPLEGAA